MLTTEILTGDDQLLGTAPYMSPEQIGGRPRIPDPTSFRLASIMFEMATGRRPFDGPRPAGDADVDSEGPGAVCRRAERTSSRRDRTHHRPLPDQGSGAAHAVGGGSSQPDRGSGADARLRRMGAGDPRGAQPVGGARWPQAISARAKPWMAVGAVVVLLAAAGIAWPSLNATPAQTGDRRVARFTVALPKNQRHRPWIQLGHCPLGRRHVARLHVAARAGFDPTCRRLDSRPITGIG